MIKTYDEALKTLNDVRTYLAIGKADDCVQELDKVAKYFINEKHKESPNLYECIKEWEERGWKVRNIDVGFKFCKNSNSINFYVKEYNGEPTYRTSLFYIDYELSCLIQKTLKALEVKDE